MNLLARLHPMLLMLVAIAGLGALTTAAAQPVPFASDGALYSLTNSDQQNQVAVFKRSNDGSLRFRRFVNTGGSGTGGGLGNQGALALSESGEWLLAVNAGSNSVSVFYVFGRNLIRTDVTPSGGERPVSVAIKNNLVYVLNAGSDTLQGFQLSRFGKLFTLPGSETPLSGTGTGAAQVGFNRAGDLLVVTEKATNLVLSFPVDPDGLLGAVNVRMSPTPTPFGFAFGRRDQLFVTEASGGAANASTMTSYELAADGDTRVITSASPDMQSAACWVTVTRDGRFAYVSNTGSSNISAYMVDEDGALSLIGDGQAASTGMGSAPIDLAMDPFNQYLYSLNSMNGTISAFRIGKDGSLDLIEIQASGLPASATGLIAR